MLDNKTRYLQIAFNFNTRMVGSLLPRIPPSSRIMIEAGTPYLKREGMQGIRYIRRLWRGLIVADIKIADGALDEVQMVRMAFARKTFAAITKTIAFSFSFQHTIEF